MKIWVTIDEQDDFGLWAKEPQLEEDSWYEHPEVEPLMVSKEFDSDIWNEINKALPTDAETDGKYEITITIKGNED